MRGTVRARGGAGPAFEGAAEFAGVGIADRRADLGDGGGTGREQVVGGFATHAVVQFAPADAGFAQAATQGLFAEMHGVGDVDQARLQREAFAQELFDARHDVVGLVVRGCELRATQFERPREPAPRPVAPRIEAPPAAIPPPQPMPQPGGPPGGGRGQGGGNREDRERR